MVLNVTKFANATNIQNVTSALTYVESVTRGTFGLFIVIGAFATAFIVASRWGNERAFTTASFFAFITAAMLAPLGLTGANEIILTSVGVLASLFMLYWTHRQ